MMRDLIEAFWPGGLTVVVEHAPSLAWDLGDARGTVAVRMPLHPIALDLLAETGPMAVSSANVSGQPPAVTAQQAYAQLGESVSVYLDGGEVPVGLPSTIVDLTGQVPTVLRQGAISLAALREVVPGVEAGSVG
jgi:tRNA threonylcarbamoyl adenosine modification protein (Sua5/YciO/YrdC/YwlC family)